MNDNQTENYFENDMLCILYQIYSILDKIKDIYTHYDLHDHNVIMYRLPVNEYIIMSYKFRNTKIMFKTNIIIKLIDYGRSFFIKTSESRKSVCNERSCNTGASCGTDKGFGYIKERLLTNNHWINSYKKNISHDLRLTQFIKTYISEKNSVLYPLINNIYYSEFYGTPENVTTYSSSPTIYNITSFIQHITNEINTSSFRINNDKHFTTMKCIGNMTIFMDSKKKFFFSSY
jgi:hypothetical protein